MASNFANKVLDIVRLIPKGQTLNYKQVAKLASRPKAQRAVGNILNNNYDPNIPCHRVIRSNGEPGAYNRGAKKKIKLLRLEGALLILIMILCPSIAHAARWRPIPVKPEYTRPPEVRNWKLEAGARHAVPARDWIEDRKSRFLAFDKTETGGGNLATGDVDGDGQPEIIVSAGKGNQPLVRVFTSDGKLKKSFYAYLQGFRGGASVAVADTDGDGKSEIITAPGPGAEAKIHIFNADGTHKLKGEALAYQAKFKGGAHVAAVDLNADGKAEIITSPGPGGGPHVKIFSGQMENLALDFFPFDAKMTDGITLSIIQTPDGPNIVAAIESWNLPLVKTYKIDLTARAIVQKSEFLAFDQTSKNGVTLAAFDYDGDGNDEIIATRNGGEWPEARIFDRYGTLITKVLLQDPDYRGSLSLAQLNTQLLVMPSSPVIVGPTDKDQTVEVDLSDQRLYAYEHGRIAKSFLVSTGSRKYPTPVMSTEVKRKILLMDYRWSYGKDHPDNYFLPDVKYNLEVRPHYFIHYAYWHNNFGYRMSHGCVNASLEDAKWIYDWADIGTPVEVHE